MEFALDTDMMMVDECGEQHWCSLQPHNHQQQPVQHQPHPQHQQNPHLAMPATLPGMAPSLERGISSCSGCGSVISVISDKVESPEPMMAGTYGTSAVTAASTSASTAAATAATADEYPIYVCSLTGRTITLEVRADFTVRDVKRAVERCDGYPVHTQRLIFDSQEVEDSKTLAAYGIVRESIVYMVLRLRY